MALIDDFSQECECTYKGEHYKVRDNGAVYRLPLEGKKPRKLDNVWTFGTKSATNGYMTIGGHRVHIIVATAFHGENDSKVYVVDHIDTNRCNNRVENLRWLTKLENILLNPITRNKIEYICGSVESFLEDPSQLKGYEYDDRNFEWMRAVSKEEAAITLKNWQHLIETPRTQPATGKVGDWIMKNEIGTTGTPLPAPISANTNIEQNFTPTPPPLPTLTAEELNELKQKQSYERVTVRRVEAKSSKSPQTLDRNRMQSVLESLSGVLDFEVKTKYPVGDNKVDFFISRGDKKLALQVFRPTRKVDEQLKAYKEANIMGCWLGSGNDCRFSQSQTILPDFKIERDGDSFKIYLTGSHSVSLTDFITAALEAKLVVKNNLNVNTIKVRFVPYSCYKCGYEHYVYIVSGIVTDVDTKLQTPEGMYGIDPSVLNSFNPVIVESVKLYLENHPEIVYPMGEIKQRFSKTADHSYLSFGCPNCDSIIGDWYLKDMHMELIYEPDDEFVHQIDLLSPLEIEYPHWEILS